MTNEKSADYAPRWISHAKQILAGLNDGTRSIEADKTTCRIITRIVQTLAKGNALSAKQATAFVESIRVRLGKPDFVWTGPIKLTRPQLGSARAFADSLGVKAAPGRIDAGLVGVTREDYDALVARVAHLEGLVGQILSNSCSYPAPILSDSCSIPAEIAQNLPCDGGFPDLTIRNETKRNHDGDMNCPSGISMTSISSMSGPAAANDLLPSTQDMKYNGHGRKTGAAAERAVVSYFRNDPEQAPSANLEFGGERFSLVFHSADVAEGKLASVCSKEWMDMFDREGGSELRARSRLNADTDFRYVLSPIYGEKDRFGYKPPVVEDCAAVLVWSDDGEPLAVVVLAGTSVTSISLAPTNAAKRKPKGPLYKGSEKIAA